MRTRITVTLLLLVVMLLGLNMVRAEDKTTAKQHKTIFDLEANDISGEMVSFAGLKGKVVFLVNIASKCGFVSQLKQLQQLHEKYQDQGLEILAFPCNQFGSQEPLKNEQIVEFCSLNYGVTFKVFAKTDVNGKNAHPVFKFAKKALPGFMGNSIKWNFTKFLFNREGKGFHRYSPTTSPNSMEDDIKKLLAK